MKQNTDFHISTHLGYKITYQGNRRGGSFVPSC